MKKMTTLFKKNPENLGRVINELNPKNAWVYESGIATRKFDGTACAIINGELYKRYDAKKGKKAPEGAIPCQEADEQTGHHPHWVKCDRNDKSVKYHFEAFDKLDAKENGTYELCGPKINKNKEKFAEHLLIPHGLELLNLKDFTFKRIKEYLENPANDIEGIVFHDSKGTGKMCKIRKSDFGIKR